MSVVVLAYVVLSGSQSGATLGMQHGARRGGYTRTYGGSFRILALLGKLLECRDQLVVLDDAAESSRESAAACLVGLRVERGVSQPFFTPHWEDAPVSLE